MSLEVNMKNWFKTHSDRLMAIFSYLLTIAHIIMTVLFWCRYETGVGTAIIVPIVWTVMTSFRILLDFIHIWFAVPEKK